MVVVNEANLKISDKANALVNKVRQTYDYLKGKTNTTITNLEKAYPSDIKVRSKELDKIYTSFKNNKAKIDVKMSDRDKAFVVTFSSTEVPTELVNYFKPGDKYSKFVSNYDADSNEVELIIPYDKDSGTDEESDQAEDKQEESLLSETDNLKITGPEAYYDTQKEDFYLKVGINGKDYKYYMKSDSPYSIDQMFNKINGMLKYSSGKALQFIKKNMNGVKVESMVTKVNKENLFLELDTHSAKDTSLKKNHICSGCGKTLDQCTCEVEDEDKVNEALTESSLGTDLDKYQKWVDYDMKKYHKISNKTNDEIRKAGLQVVKDEYGAYQVIAGKYDESLKEKLNLNSEGKALKRSIKNIIVDNDDELREFVSAIVEEVISERNSFEESLNESSDPFDYDESSEADQVLYDSISTFLADRFCPAFNIDINIVSQFSRFEDIMESLVRMVKQGRDATKKESLDEDCGTSATQTSNVGQHKTDSIDLLEPKESLNLDSEGKRLKKLISQLVTDSDEELRDYVNKITDEVIEERNETPATQTSGVDRRKSDSTNVVTEEVTSEFTEVKSKVVTDSDGFTTDYTWYKDSSGNNLFIFGDKDFYDPENTDPDFETESDEEAEEWFDNYSTDEE